MRHRVECKNDDDNNININNNNKKSHFHSVTQTLWLYGAFIHIAANLHNLVLLLFFKAKSNQKGTL